MPTDCTQAYGSIGCCAGNTVYYCSGGTSGFTSKACTSGKVCGWDSEGSSGGYYYCVASPGGVDPSGNNPINCQ